MNNHFHLGSSFPGLPPTPILTCRLHVWSQVPSQWNTHRTTKLLSRQQRRRQSRHQETPKGSTKEKLDCGHIYSIQRRLSPHRLITVCLNSDYTIQQATLKPLRKSRAVNPDSDPGRLWRCEGGVGEAASDWRRSRHSTSELARLRICSSSFDIFS